jgi:hypothetical protein
MGKKSNKSDEKKGDDPLPFFPCPPLSAPIHMDPSDYQTDNPAAQLSLTFVAFK